MKDSQGYQLTFTEKILGGAPLDKSAWEKYVKNDLTEQDEDEMMPESSDVTAGITGFYKDTDGLYLFDYHIKGFLKEAGNILKDIVRIKNLRSKIDNFLFVEPRAVWLAEKPDGILERPLRGMTAQGPRVVIARSEYLRQGTAIKIRITIINHREVNFDVVEKLLDYGALKGIGQWRNGSYGRFVWERTEGGNCD